MRQVGTTPLKTMMKSHPTRRHALAALLLGAFALVAPASTAQTKDEGPSAIEIIDKVQGFYDKTKTYKADFRQKYKIRAYNKVKRSEGNVIFRKPGKMSWRYGNGNRVVSNGKTLKVYERDNKQMVVQSVDKSQYPAALAFLTGGGKLKKEFKLRKFKTVKAGWIIEAKPKKATPAYTRVLLYIDRRTYHVRRVALVDAQRNINRFDFNKAKVNVKVRKSEFTFEPPKGTKVVRP